MTMKDMLGRGGVVSREEALTVVLRRLVIPPLRTEDVVLSDASGRVLAADIVSPADLPEFDRSTMDGYAVRSADTFGASESLPALLTIAGDIPMGTMPARAVGRGECMRIATGGALPPGADAVVMLEHCQAVDGGSIETTKAVAPQENVSFRGEDLRAGDAVLVRGHRLRPQDLSALASIGIVQVPVYERPRVAIISTGTELVPADRAPGPGCIRDSNSYALEALIVTAGGEPKRMGIIPDDPAKLADALAAAAAGCRLALVTGGSSVGTADHTARVIDGLGDPGVIVHGVAIKPGKPLIAGMVKGADAPVPVFGLPGHPVAVIVCFEVFVRPVLERLTGEVPRPALAALARERSVRARLARSIPSAAGREDHVRVALELRDGALCAVPVFGASGLIGTLVRADGTVIVQRDAIGIEAGEVVDVRLF